MNCANHPERTATAFCQNCGKALCPECIRTADGLFLCEPCLLARHPEAPGAPVSGYGAPNPAAAAAGWSAVRPGTAQPPYAAIPGAAPGQYPGSRAGQPSPFLAGLLGFIPGVGAMYNGQFVKGLIHVVIFIVLVGITGHMPLAGMLIAAWEFYQVFDAAQTASARRDGRPLPDPFGLLDLSQRLGPAAATYAPPASGPAAPPVPPPMASTGAPAAEPWTASGTGSGSGASRWEQPAPAYRQPPAYRQGYVPDPRGGWTTHANAPVPSPRRRGEPIGAIVLIVLGLLFLLNTLDVFNFDWIGRGWPLILLGIGIWLLVRRSSRYGGSPPPPVAPAGSYTPPPTPGNSLSIYPQAGPQGGQPQTAEDAATERPFSQRSASEAASDSDKEKP